MCAVVLAVGVVIGILFLKETHEDRKHRRDVGLEAGKWLLGLFRRFEKAEKNAIPLTDKSAARKREEIHTLMREEELPEYTPVDGSGLPGYQTKEGTPRQSSSRAQSPGARAASGFSSSSGKPKGVSKAFTKQVMLVIIAFGILA